MRRWVWSVVVGVLSMTVSATELSRWYLPMLLDEDRHVVKAGARVVYHSYASDELATDIVAARLYQDIVPDPKSEASDQLSWYAKALGMSGNGKYRALLQRVREIAPRSKVRTYAGEALEQLPEFSGEPFSPASLDFDALRAQYPLTFSEFREYDKMPFRSLTPMMPVDAMFTHLGTPWKLGLMSTRYNRYAVVDEVGFHYPGAGVVFLKLIKTPTPHYALIAWYEEPFPIKEFYQGEDYDLAQLLATVRGQNFRHLIKTNSDVIAGDEGLLRILGERMSTYLPTPVDKYEADGMAIAVKLIARSSDPETLKHLRPIAKNDSAGKAQDVAQGYIEDGLLKNAPAMP